MKKSDAAKLPAGVDQVFVDNIQSMSTDDLKALIVELQVNVEEAEAFKLTPEYIEAEERLKAERERFNDGPGAIKETIKGLRNKTKIVVERLQAKGAV